MNVSKQKRFSFSPMIYDLIIVVSLFLLSFYVRLTHIVETVSYQPIRNDAIEYFNGAYNLQKFGVFSTESPSLKVVKPKPCGHRVPGFSFFLSLILKTNDNVSDFVNRVRYTHAIIGSLVAVMSYLMARFCFNYTLALIIGCLTGLSPHLISMEYYILSETLFTFTLMIAVILLMASWKYEKYVLALLSGVFFGCSILIRPVALMLGPFIAVVYFINSQEFKIKMNQSMIALFFCCILGIVLTYGPLIIRNKISLGNTDIVGGPLANIVFGSYINLTHNDPRFYGFPYRDDPNFERMSRDKKYFFKVLKERIQARPWDYFRWYAGGKVLCSWRWNIATGRGDVYVYPVVKAGFYSNRLLYTIHTAMRWIHWPLVCITLLFPFVLYIYWRIQIPNKLMSPMLLPPLVMILYHAIVLTILFPLPRYTIPIRPYCYMLSIGVLAYFFQLIRKRVKIFNKQSERSEIF